jgi:exodeoxyribonuclease VIII
MIDIETLGTGPDAALLSLGAVKFNPSGDGVIDAFYIRIDAASCEQFGLSIDAKTVAWWMSGDRRAARDALDATDPVDLPSALDGFAAWLGPDSMPVWGNGATFDNVIVRSAYDAIGMECPWKFWHDRCFRTYKNLAKHIAPPKALMPADSAVPHHALFDAHLQALHMQVISEFLGVKAVA